MIIPIHDTIAERARRQPDAVALESSDMQMTYRELDQRSLRLAYRLIASGGRRGDIVGIQGRPSCDRVAAVLGTLRAGMAFLPLDHAAPAPRLAFMLEQASPHTVLVDERVAASVEHRGQSLTLSQAMAPIDAVVLPATDPDDLAYVIYTSGSTGRPKGVMITHRGIPGLVGAQIRDFELGDRSRVLQFASFSFDAAISEMFTTLAAGGALVVLDRDALLPGPTLQQVLRERRVTTVTLPPAALAELDPADLPDLSTVISAGEACPVEVVRRWAVGRRLINAYGPTEATVCASEGLCRADDPAAPGIGSPIGDVRLAVLDSSLCPVGAGQVGELFISGSGLARGYLDQPALTAERFLPDPGADRPGQRLYRTGDRVLRRADGTLEFVGRTDDQVKLRGYRIELGDVEAALTQHPGVRQAVVTLDRGPSGPRLIAHVLASPGTTSHQLRQSVRARLPDYMVPAAIVPIETWPLTASGKIDRAALPAPPLRDAAEPVAPRDPVERALLAMFQAVLGIDQVGVHDDFFTLGGNSLLGARLLTRIRGELQLALTIADLAENPSVAGLAARGRDGTARRPRSLCVTLQRGGAGTPLFLCAPGSGSVVCYVPLALRLAADRAVHGLESPGLHGDVAPVARIHDIASRQLDALLAVQPQGPYLLGGWSLGGAVAFELASQLARAGAVVSTLIMIDSTAPTDLVRKGSLDLIGQDMSNEAAIAYLYVRNVGRCRNIEPELSPADFEVPRSELLGKMVREMQKLVGDDRDGVNERDLAVRWELFRSMLVAFVSYRPDQPYAGRVISFDAGRIHLDWRQRVADWSEFVSGPIETHPLHSGDHYTVVDEPHVDELARLVRAALARGGA